MQPPDDKRRYSAMRRRVFRLAKDTLVYAAQGADEKVYESLREVAKMPVGSGEYMMRCWIDLFIDHALDGADPGGQRVTFEFWSSDNQLEAIENVPEEVRWAGAIIKARSALDQDEYNRVINAVPDGQADQYVLALLGSVAHSINEYPRGYARVDRNWHGGQGLN